MIIYYYTEISKQILDYVNDLYRAQLKKFIKNTLKKSIRLFFIKTDVYDQHKDNFVRNTVTVVSYFNGYKIPRIVKQLLTHKL